MHSVRCLAFSNDCKTLASGSADKTIKIWDIRKFLFVEELYGHTDEVNSIAFSLDGVTLASASKDKSIKIWNI